jgi:hypothetical protein
VKGKIKMISRTIDGLSKSQAARELGVSSTRVDQLMNAGVLPYCNTALGRLVDPEAVAALKIEREKNEVAMSSAKK